MSICKRKHIQHINFSELPKYQGTNGRHRCVGCAYEKGYELGVDMNATINFDFNSLDKNQAGVFRHKNPHIAFMLGYIAGAKKKLNDR